MRTALSVELILSYVFNIHSGFKLDFFVERGGRGLILNSGLLGINLARNLTQQQRLRGKVKVDLAVLCLKQPLRIQSISLRRSGRSVGSLPDQWPIWHQLISSFNTVTTSWRSRSMKTSLRKVKGLFIVSNTLRTCCVGDSRLRLSRNCTSK